MPFEARSYSQPVHVHLGSADGLDLLSLRKGLAGIVFSLPPGESVRRLACVIIDRFSPEVSPIFVTFASFCLNFFVSFADFCSKPLPAFC